MSKMLNIRREDLAELLSLAWESGAYTRAMTPPEISVQNMNPYKKRTSDDLSVYTRRDDGQPTNGVDG